MAFQQEVDWLTEAFADLTVSTRRQRSTASTGGLLGLPAELLNDILTRVGHAADQASLVRTCKALGHLVVPMLYHTVTLEISVSNKTKLSGLQTKNNPGLRFLHELTIIPCDQAHREWTSEHFISGPELALPPFVLRKLHCDGNAPKLRAALWKFWTRHQTVTFTVVSRAGGDEWNAIATDKRDPLSYPRLAWLANCSELFIHVEACYVALTNFNKAMWMSTNLKTLAVNFEPMQTPQDERGRLMHRLKTLRFIILFDAMRKKCDEGTHTRYSKSVFLDSCHCWQHSTVHDLKLRRAEFGRGLGLIWTVPLLSLTWLRQLTVLVLQDCSGCTTFLEAMATQNTTFALKRLVVVSASEPPQTSLESTVDKLLLAFCGLETLVVSGLTDRPPSAQAVARHATSLRCLYVAGSDGGNCLGLLNWIEQICSTCVRLEQLAWPMAPLALEQVTFSAHSTPHGTHSFGKGLAHQFMGGLTVQHVPCNEFKDCLDNIVKLPNLVTLRMLDVNYFGNSSSLYGRTCLFHQLDLLAGYTLRMFHESGHKELTVLSFGRTDGQNACDEPISYYVEGSRLDRWDEKRSSMVHMGFARVRSEEPRSHILEMGVNRPGFLR